MSRAVAPNVAADAELDDGFTESELLSTTLPTPSTYSSTQYSQSSSRPAAQAPPVQPKLNVEGKIGSAVPIVGGPILINMPKIDTLDESVAVTLKRDLRNIWRKLKLVLLPQGSQDILKEWDLWGPLLLCLTLAIVMGIMAPGSQSTAVFTGVFFIVWFGAAVVTVNSKLLGGKISFFQSVCVLGYCIFPLDIAAILCLFLPYILVRGLLVTIAYIWCTFASIRFLKDASLEKRKWLATYPIVLFYFVLSWMILISKSLI